MEPTASTQRRSQSLRRLRHRHARRRARLAHRTIVILSQAPFTYQIYLAVHVIAAVIWVGGDITLTTLGIVFERRKEARQLAALGRMGAWIGVKVYTPALFVVIAFGVALMLEGDQDWGQFWVIFGLVGWAIAAVIGVGFVGPELGRIDEAARPTAPTRTRSRSRQATLHDLPVRHGPAGSDRAQHGGETDVLATQVRPALRARVARERRAPPAARSRATRVPVGPAGPISDTPTGRPLRPTPAGRPQRGTRSSPRDG